MATYYYIGGTTGSLTTPSDWSTTSGGSALSELIWADGDTASVPGSTDSGVSRTVSFNGTTQKVNLAGGQGSKQGDVTFVVDSNTNINNIALDNHANITANSIQELRVFGNVVVGFLAPFATNNISYLDICGDGQQILSSANPTSGAGIDPDVPIFLNKTSGEVYFLQWCSGSGNAAHDSLKIYGASPTIKINDTTTINTVLGKTYSPGSFGPIELVGDVTCESLELFNGVSASYPTQIQIPSGKKLTATETTWGTNCLIDGVDTDSSGSADSFGTYCTTCVDGAQNDAGEANYNVVTGIAKTCIFVVTLPQFSVVETVSTTLDSISVVSGQVIVCKDTGGLFIDTVSGERKQVIF